jgi:hypothetical protein
MVSLREGIDRELTKILPIAGHLSMRADQLQGPSRQLRCLRFAVGPSLEGIQRGLVLLEHLGCLELSS